MIDATVDPGTLGNARRIIAVIESGISNPLPWSPTHYPFAYAYDYLRCHAEEFRISPELAGSRTELAEWCRRTYVEDAVRLAVIVELAEAHLRENHIVKTLYTEDEIDQITSAEQSALHPFHPLAFAGIEIPSPAATVRFLDETRRVLAEVPLADLGGSVPAVGEVLHLSHYAAEPDPDLLWHTVTLIERTITLHEPRHPGMHEVSTCFEILLGKVGRDRLGR